MDAPSDMLAANSMDTPGDIGSVWWREPFVGLAVSVVAIGLVAIVTASVRGTIAYPSADYGDWDHNKYIAMSETPLGDEVGSRTAPFVWRMLTPLAVYASPLSTQPGFHLVSVTGLVLAAYFLYLFLADLGFGTSYRVYGVVLFATLYHAVAFNLWDVYLTDPLGLASVSLVFVLFVRRRFIVLAAALAVAVLNKEVVLLTFPALATIAIVDRDRRDWLRGVATVVIIFAPAAIVAAVIRLLIEPVNDYRILNLDAAMTFFSRRFDGGPIEALTELTRWSFITWGALAVLFLTTLNTSLRQVVVTRPWMIVFALTVLLQLLFAGNTERLLVYAFPVMVPVGLAAISELARQLDVSTFRFGFFVLVPHLLLFVAQITKGLETSDAFLRSAVAVLMACLIVIVVASTVQRYRRVQGNEGAANTALPLPD